MSVKVAECWLREHVVVARSARRHPRRTQTHTRDHTQHTVAPPRLPPQQRTTAAVRCPRTTASTVQRSDTLCTQGSLPRRDQYSRLPGRTRCCTERTVRDEPRLYPYYPQTCPRDRTRHTCHPCRGTHHTRYSRCPKVQCTRRARSSRGKGRKPCVSAGTIPCGRSWGHT